ncbi:MAG: sulfotransferase [Xanthomonadales bacterium]|nr:sulfotransferase [Xanthomonadales bacterium]
MKLDPALARDHQKAQQLLNRGDLRGAHQLCANIARRAPAFADSWFLLGIIAAAAGQLGKAIELMRQALERDNGPAEYHCHLARCLTQASQFPQAHAAADQALSREIKDPLTADTLGVVLSRLNRHPEALPLFDLAVAHKPDRPDFLFNRAASRKFVGRVEESNDDLKRAIGLAPRMWRAHSALAQQMDDSEEYGHLAALESLRASLDPADLDGALHLGHALARRYESLERFDEAIQALIEPKSRKRQALGYSFDRDQALFDQLRSTFSSELPRAAGYDTPEPVFIVGMPRSGTTLVERILTSHPAVQSAGELQQFPLALKRAAATRSRGVIDVETIQAGLRTDPAQVGRAYLESTRPMTGSTDHFIDKNPLNFLLVGFILRSLPQARVIILRRHPLDTVIGNFRQLFAVDYSYYNYALDLEDTARFCRGFLDLRALWAERFPGRVTLVDYESVVDDLEGEARRLVDFLGLPWDPACVDFASNPSAVATASAVQVRRGLYRDALERWRRYESHLAGARRILGLEA